MITLKAEFILSLSLEIFCTASLRKTGLSVSKKPKQNYKVLDKEAAVNAGVSKNVRKYRRYNGRSKDSGNIGHPKHKTEDEEHK